MQVNVTQNLAVRIVPVNNPNKTKNGNQDGFYRAYVSNDDSKFGVAENEARRGIVPEFVGYGIGPTPQGAATNALWDYAAKFGPLCIAGTKTRGEA
jgi:hypothetical protein